MQDFLKSGKINKETYIIKEGDSDWRLLMEYSEFNENSATQNSDTPSENQKEPKDNQSSSSSSNTTIEQLQTEEQPRKKMTIKEFTQKYDFIDEEGLCPSCGYFAGSLLTCPRCGARTANKISLVIVKKIAVIGSIIGIIILWIAAYYKQPDTIMIGDIDEKMNGALVRVEGRVTEYKEDKEKNTLKLKVDDGTGIIGINAFNKLSKLKEIFGENLPKVGDKIEVIGTINQTQKFGAAMFLSVPERLKILEKFELKEYKLSELDTNKIGEMVKIKVYVKKYETRKTKKGGTLHILTLSDNSGPTIGMTLFDKSLSTMPADVKKLLLEEKGALIEMPVTLSEYRGKLQATITDFAEVKNAGTASVSESDDASSENESSSASGGDEEASEEQPKKEYKSKKYDDANAEENTFANLTDDDIGKSYKFSAEVSKVNKKGDNVMLTLVDSNNKKMSVMVFKNQQDKIKDFDSIDKGSKISGIFEVSEYKGKLQLKIKNPKSIKVE
ncbi:MAG TPA: OB-fold nucleic acid binding domain-containing protein [bacterium]|nr:OB-fold nucleic acid binding domain-containing protein [bacterium]